jgi:hypothetical protein
VALTIKSLTLCSPDFGRLDFYHGLVGTSPKFQGAGETDCFNYLLFDRLDTGGVEYLVSEWIVRVGKESGG